MSRSACLPEALRSVVSLGVITVAFVSACFTGCGPADSVIHDGNFTEDQKAASQAESQKVEDEESQGSNKRKPAKK